MTSIDELYKDIDDGKSGRNLGLKTGLPKLDWYTGGFRKKVYKLWFGLSGSGKSSVVIYTQIYRILKDYPDADVLYVYFSLEMSSSVLLAKILSLYLYEEFGLEISYMDLLSFRNTISNEVYAKVQLARKWLDSISNKLIIFDKQLNAKSFYAAMMEVLKLQGTFSKTEDERRTIYTPNNEKLIINVVLDHAGLCSPSEGRKKKEEIDLISAYCVRFRELCDISIDFIMQENRNAGDIDRQKMQITECTMDDVKESGNPGNDCTVCIAVYYPIKYQLKTYRQYKIADNKETGEIGLGSAARGLILLKNRFGSANKVFCVGFQGSIGRFVELPKPDLIDYYQYQSWKDDKLENNTTEDTIIKDIDEKDKKCIKYKF